MKQHGFKQWFYQFGLSFLLYLTDDAIAKSCLISQLVSTCCKLAAWAVGCLCQVCRSLSLSSPSSASNLSLSLFVQAFHASLLNWMKPPTFFCFCRRRKPSGGKGMQVKPFAGGHLLPVSAFYFYLKHCLPDIIMMKAHQNKEGSTMRSGSMVVKSPDIIMMMAHQNKERIGWWCNEQDWNSRKQCHPRHFKSPTS